MTDAAHTKGIDLSQFAGVQNETLGLDPLIEILELVTRVFWGMEGDDNRRLNGRWHKAANAQGGHAVKQGLAVLGVALMTGWQTALFVVLRQRLVQRRHHVRWRGKAPLPGFGHIGVLVVQVHCQGMRVTRRVGQCVFARKDKAHARYAFQAFAGRCDQGIEGRFLCIDGQGTE